MSNVIQFLEALGQNPAPADYAAAVAALDIDEAQRQALLNRDHARLNDLLGGRSKVYCVVVPAEEEEPLDDEKDPSDKEPDDSDNAIRLN
jgi:hypothetical protein